MGHVRITSYNVCYTKLLRMAVKQRWLAVLTTQITLQGGKPVAMFNDGKQQRHRAYPDCAFLPLAPGRVRLPGLYPRGEILRRQRSGDPEPVITSYSIHYTKLYEEHLTATARQNKRHRHCRCSRDSNRPASEAHPDHTASVSKFSEFSEFSGTNNLVRIWNNNLTLRNEAFYYQNRQKRPAKSLQGHPDNS